VSPSRKLFTFSSSATPKGIATFNSLYGIFLTETEEYEKVLKLANRLNLKVPKVIRFIVQQYINEEKKGD